MKKVPFVLLVLLIPSFAFAESTYEPITIGSDNGFRYMDVSMGYGYTFLADTSKGTIDSHALDLALSFGYAFSSSTSFQFGLALRLDMPFDLTSAGKGDNALNILFGPLMVFNLARRVNLNLTLGPSLNLLSIKKLSVISLAPALDFNIEFIATDGLTFKLGSALYGQIGLSERAFGLTVAPYASASLRFSGTSSSSSSSSYTAPPPPKKDKGKRRR